MENIFTIQNIIFFNANTSQQAITLHDLNKNTIDLPATKIELRRAKSQKLNVIAFSLR